MSGCFTDKYTDYPFTPLPFLSTSDQPYAPVMKTPQLSFSRIVRESGTTLVVTMSLYLVPGCTVALLPTANYRQVSERDAKCVGEILVSAALRSAAWLFDSSDGPLDFSNRAEFQHAA